MATSTFRQIGISALLKAAREERGRAGEEIRLVVAGSGSPLRHVAAALSVHGGSVHVIEGGASSEILGSPVPPAGGLGGGAGASAGFGRRQATASTLGMQRSDVCVLVAEGLTAAEQSVIVNEARDAKAKLVVVLPPGPAAQATSRNALQAGAMTNELTTYDPQLPIDRGDLGAKLAEAAEDRGPDLAGAVPVLRHAVVQHLIRTASRQNGVVGIVVFVPGADLPIMTLNQVRMVLRIGRAYGFEVDPDRVPEILGVIAAGVGFRALAREALGLVPVAGWAVKGFFGYTGTLALGRAAIAFYERGALGKQRSVADRIPDGVRERVASRIPDSLQGSLNKVLERVGLSKDGS